MSVHIRRAGPKDLDDLLDLYRDLHPDDEPPPSEPERTVRFLEALETVDILVAEVDGRPAATAMLAVVPNPTRGMRPFGVVENVVTRADCRGKGIGGRLMSRLIGLARRKGCYKVMLLSKQTPEAYGLYKSLGFEEGAKTGLTLRLTSPDTNGERQGFKDIQGGNNEWL